MLSMDFIPILIHSLSYIDFKGGEIATTFTAKFGGGHDEEHNLEEQQRNIEELQKRIASNQRNGSQLPPRKSMLPNMYSLIKQKQFFQKVVYCSRRIHDKDNFCEQYFDSINSFFYRIKLLIVFICVTL